MPPGVDPLIRVRLDVRGQVQGVGFRPFAYRLASKLELAGYVTNNGFGALIEIEGLPIRVSTFERQLVAQLPRDTARESPQPAFEADRLPDLAEAGVDGAVREERRVADTDGPLVHSVGHPPPFVGLERTQLGTNDEALRASAFCNV